MLTDKEIQLLFFKYPDGVNKDILRKECHISPRTAQYLLESGKIPCEIRPQKTHRYLISTSDMIMYLKDREKHPDKYHMPLTRNQLKGGKHHSRQHCLSEAQLQSITEASYSEACQKAVANCPDIMSTQQAIEVIGYSSKKILNWYRENKLICVNIRGHVFIPRLALYEFMLTDEFRTIRIKSNRHWELLSMAVPKKG